MFYLGNVLADKYLYYQKVRAAKFIDGKKIDDVVYINASNIKKTIEGKTMDELKLTRICCRIHMLTHVDIIG